MLPSTTSPDATSAALQRYKLHLKETGKSLDGLEGACQALSSYGSTAFNVYSPTVPVMKRSHGWGTSGAGGVSVSAAAPPSSLTTVEPKLNPTEVGCVFDEALSSASSSSSLAASAGAGAAAAHATCAPRRCNGSAVSA
jgi:hypothetical protein